MYFQWKSSRIFFLEDQTSSKQVRLWIGCISHGESFWEDHPKAFVLGERRCHHVSGLPCQLLHFGVCRGRCRRCDGGERCLHPQFNSFVCCHTRPSTRSTTKASLGIRSQGFWFEQRRMSKQLWPRIHLCWHHPMVWKQRSFHQICSRDTAYGVDWIFHVSMPYATSISLSDLHRTCFQLFGNVVSDAEARSFRGSVDSLCHWNDGGNKHYVANFFFETGDHFMWHSGATALFRHLGLFDFVLHFCHLRCVQFGRSCRCQNHCCECTWCKLAVASQQRAAHFHDAGKRLVCL